jgi:hypothetical protein
MNGSGSSETTGSDIGPCPKALLVDRSHNPWREADRRAAYGRSVCAVRGGGGWRRTSIGTAPVLDPTNESANVSLRADTIDPVRTARGRGAVSGQGSSDRRMRFDLAPAETAKK